MRYSNTGFFGIHRGCTEARTWNLQCVALLRAVSKHRGWSAAISSQKAACVTARFGRSSTPMILTDSKGLSSELLLISDGEFFEAPLILVIFPKSDAGSWDLT